MLNDFLTVFIIINQNKIWSEVNYYTVLFHFAFALNFALGYAENICGLHILNICKRPALRDSSRFLINRA